jgi:hypothetical protein
LDDLSENRDRRQSKTRNRAVGGRCSVHLITLTGSAMGPRHAEVYDIFHARMDRYMKRQRVRTRQTTNRSSSILPFIYAFIIMDEIFRALRCALHKYVLYIKAVFVCVCVFKFLKNWLISS